MEQTTEQTTGQTTDRKLAAIRKINNIKAIPEADSICAYGVDGWFVVDQIGKYQVGDTVVYVEPDSWVPTALAPFLSKGKDPREYEGIKGERLKTIRLRGQYSQGLILPLVPTCDNIESELFEGLDVTYPLGIVKWDRPLPACLAGLAKGNFPSFIRKTDQERIQNMPEILEDTETVWEVSIKLDGSSSTNYFRDDYFGVCSRNLDLKDSEGNSFWSTVKKNGLATALPKLGRNLAVQGELMGEGIQRNQEKLKGQKLFVFDIFDIDAYRDVTPEERLAIIDELNVLGATLEIAPILEYTTLARFNGSMEEILIYAEGPSLNPDVKREGVVFKSVDGTKSFKVVSNAWLLKNDARD